MNIWLNILLILVLVSIIVMEVAENGHPIRTLAWIMVLIFLPVVGLILYFFFGRDRKKRRLATPEDANRMQELTAVAVGENVCTDPPESCRNLITLLHTARKAAPVTGNDVRVFTDFRTMYDDMLADLESARHHIHFQFFKFEDDEFGRQVEEILVRKVREGVEVRLQVDDLANLTRRRFYRRMADKGVQVRSFLRVRLLLSSDTNYRNHRKNVVVDGRVGYTGGMNIAKRYAVGVGYGVWRDTHIRVEGPAVAQLQTAFLLDWKFSTKQLLDDPVYFPQVPAAGPYMMQVATSGPMGEFRVIMQAILRIINESHSYVYVETPYFIPNEPLTAALRNAALAGVDIRLIIPSRDDISFIVSLAARSYIKDLLAAGVKIYFYEKGFMHSKTLVSDDRVFSVGSTNLDIRSFEQNFEINAFIYDQGMAVRMREDFLRDQADCSRIDPEEWSRRPRTVRFVESVARLFSPLL